MYPKSFESLINVFLRLPGVGKKTAERYAYHIVKSFKEEDINQFIKNLDNVKNKIEKCPICGFFKEDDKCYYCDSKRDESTILVVEEPKDVEAIEKCERYRGLFHVLNGVISPLNGIGPDELNISSLIERIKSNDKLVEVIIATSATVEGEATALYLNRILSKENIKVSRIAYGMPVGSSLEYSDETTIMKALEGRSEMKK